MTPTHEEVLALFREAERERAYWAEHYEELRKQYPDRYVAVHNEIVVASAFCLRDMEWLIQERGLKLTDVWLTFVAAEPRVMIL